MRNVMLERETKNSASTLYNQAEPHLFKSHGPTAAKVVSLLSRGKPLKVNNAMVALRISGICRIADSGDTLVTEK